MHIYTYTKKKIYFIIILFFLLISTVIILFLFSKLKLNYITTSGNIELNMNFQYKINHLIGQKEKIAYLTFDDGPTISSTPKVLDILKEEDVKATFFVIGKYVKNHPDLIQRVYEEGHFIANHGYNHKASKLIESNESFIQEIKQTDLEIGKALNIPNYSSHVFRFPYGFSSSYYNNNRENLSDLLKSLNYTYIDWNCLNKDSERKTSNSELLNNLKKSCKNKGTLVILMHDTTDVNDSSAVLKESISFLKSQGYIFENFYSLLNE